MGDRLGGRRQHPLCRRYAWPADSHLHHPCRCGRRRQGRDRRIHRVQPCTAHGQDIEETPDGRFRIFEGTEPDRVISTVDPEARHGHKTTAHGFDGYKAHVAVDPDSEVICAAEVSPATSGDAVVAPRLLGDLVQGQGEPAAQAVVYGDSAYGTGAHLAWLEQQRLTPMVKTRSRPPPAAGSPRTSSASTSKPRR
jgi:Transposase DDE domain